MSDKNTENVTQLKLSDIESMLERHACRALSSRGDYKVGLVGLGSDDRLLVDIFDFRVHSWWLSDSELAQTRLNGKQELIRRGIPKNKEQ